MFTTGHFQDFRSFDGVYVLSGLNNELTNSVSSAFLETSEVCHQICPVEKTNDSGTRPASAGPVPQKTDLTGYLVYHSWTL
jgi:hypothetical protein